MLVNFNPNVSNNRQQKHNFGAINQKYLDKVIKAQKGIGGDDGVIQEITDQVAFKSIPKQDALDTLEAIKKILPKGFQDSLDEDIKWVKGKNYN